MSDRREIIMFDQTGLCTSGGKIDIIYLSRETLRGLAFRVIGKPG
jgi:hypothetical protein